MTPPDVVRLGRIQAYEVIGRLRKAAAENMRRPELFEAGAP